MQDLNVINIHITHHYNMQELNINNNLTFIYTIYSFPLILEFRTEITKFENVQHYNPINNMQMLNIIFTSQKIADK